MRPPQSFYDFTRQMHQDLDLVYPDWSSDKPGGRHDLYQDFRQGYGDRAVRELAGFFERLRTDPHADLESLWFKESKADWVLSEDGLRMLFEDFENWAASPR